MNCALPIPPFAEHYERFLEVSCPRCHAWPGERCKRVLPSLAHIPHGERIEAFNRPQQRPPVHRDWEDRF